MIKNQRVFWSGQYLFPDSDDPGDEPDVGLLEGTVTFVPVWDASTSGMLSDSQRATYVKPFPFVIHEGQLMSDDGGTLVPGVKIPASIGGHPLGWVARFDVSAGNESFAVRELRFNSNPDGEVHLHNIIPAEAIFPQLPPDVVKGDSVTDIYTQGQYVVFIVGEPPRTKQYVLAFPGTDEAATAIDEARDIIMGYRDEALVSRNAAKTSETNAKASETAAGVSKSASETARTGAETARTGAQTARTGAEAERTAAQTARTGAEAARTGAETARTGAETARSDAAGYRDTAMGYRDEALASKTAAGASATAAGQSASAAAGSASAAASSESAAATSATTASTGAGTATTQAGAATASAASANNASSAANSHAGAAAASASAASGSATTAGNSADAAATSASDAAASLAQVLIELSNTQAYQDVVTALGGLESEWQGDINAAIADLVGQAPETLDSIHEMATALGNDPNFYTTMMTALGERVKTDDVRLTDARTPTTHTHTMLQVVGLVDALGAKSDAGHGHTWTEISSKPGTFPPIIGTTPTTAKSGDYQPTWAQVSGKPATFPPTIGTSSTTAKAGDYQPTWAQVSGKPTTFTPATHSHTKAEVGLANVDNTSDANKPVSTAQQAAINAKVTNAGGASGLWVGTTASLPATGTAGVLYVTY